MLLDYIELRCGRKRRENELFARLNRLVRITCTFQAIFEGYANFFLVASPLG